MEEESKKEVIPGFCTVDDYTKKGFQVLLEATKSSNALPSQREWDFYKTYDYFKKIINCEGDTVLRLMNNVLHNQQQNVNIRNRDIDEKMEMLIEANDNILEKVALGIDELNGIKKITQEAVEIQAVSAQLPVNGSWNQLNKATFSVSSSIDNMKNSSDSLNSIRLLTAKNIVRPQTYFKDKIDNRNNPWIPRITEKPNSIKPLAIFLEESEFGEMYSHPYEIELERFTPPPNQLQKASPATVKPLDQTPLVEVSTAEELELLLEELRRHTEFAMDLEHHSYRTFMGITCLLQISTKDADYLIDTFTLRDKLYILNEVFTKPSIVKILHGAVCDIQWLQRDLSLYIVNMFDTHQAAKQLGYSGLSLSYLLKRFCKVEPNKHFQLADWRIRPLPEELKTYARMDTHYLIYVYHMLRNELLKRGNGSVNILKSVIDQSTEVCKKRYIKPILRDDSYMDYYRKCKRLFDNRQLFALKELYQWRDSLARAEDESTGYILPNHMLLQISELLPREIQGILACCNPIPPLVRANLLEIHRIVLKAREQSTVKPILKEATRSRGSTFQFAKFNVDSPLHCPHDLSKSSEFRDDLPTLLGNHLKNDCIDDKRADQVVGVENTKSQYSAFNDFEISNEEDNEAVLKIRSISFLAPYVRYELIKPFIQEQEENAAAAATDKEVKAEDMSNEDRIAALHQHFVKVSKETPQIPVSDPIKKELLPSTIEDSELTSPNTLMLDTPLQKTNVSSRQTLKSMCGSRKRKRNATEDDSNLPNFKKPYNEMQEVQSPIPNLKKRQFTPKKHKQQQNNLQHTTSMEQSKCELIAGTSQKGNGSNKKDTFWKNKKKQKQRQQQFNAQTQQKFQPFDYASVDFQQFQGGASRVNNNRGPFKTDFKAKNKKKRNSRNSNNRSMTYNRRQQQ